MLIMIAKNIILSGVKSVTLFDNHRAEWKDLSAQFYLREDDVLNGHPRAQVCLRKLQELNCNVDVSCVSEINPDVIVRHEVVVCTDVSLKRMIEINELCRKQRPQIRFIAADMRGVFGRIFCDFGHSHKVYDTNGEPPIEGFVKKVTRANPGIVTVEDLNYIPNQWKNLQTGDFVVFDEIKGMKQLNGDKLRKIKHVAPYAFSIEDTTSYDEYVCGGRFREVKQPKTITFASLRDRLKNPGKFLTTDYSKELIFPPDFGSSARSKLMHVAWQALDRFQQSHDGRCPSPSSAEDSKHLLNETAKLIKEIPAKGAFQVADMTEAQQEIVKSFGRCSAGQLSSTATVVGGIAAQEVIKAISGKFMPITQWLYFDAAECLPPNNLPSSEFTMTNTRYDGQIAVFGHSMHNKLMNLRYFLIGSGGIGCEMLKILCMMGVGARKGMVHVADMSCIKRSDLSRCFLYREKDVKNIKSIVATASIRALNPDFRVRAWDKAVGPDSENVFDDEFWDRLDGVCHTSDTRSSRLYADKRCVFNNIPLFVSSTNGRKGFTEVAVPHLTAHYGAKEDEESSICFPPRFVQFCPFQIEQTIAWARNDFERFFVQRPNDINECREDFAAFMTHHRHGFSERYHDAMKEPLIVGTHTSFDECIEWARFIFEELFTNKIRELLLMHPKNNGDIWNGSSTRPCPTPIKFDANDEAHMDFVVAAANLRATICGLKGSRDRAHFRRVLPKVRVPTFKSRVGGLSDSNDEKEKDVEAMRSKLSKVAEDDRLFPLKFDVEDDTNFHLDYVTAASNLRARSFRIEEVDKFHTKRIVNRIKPAVVTTTAVVSGLISMEMYKLLQGCKVEAFRKSFLNLAIPLFAISEPMGPAKYDMPTGDQKFSIWDRIQVPGPLSLEEFIAFIEKTYNAEVSMILYGNSALYTDAYLINASNVEKRKHRMKMTMDRLAVEKTKRPLNAKARYLALEVILDDGNGDTMDFPIVRYEISGLKLRQRTMLYCINGRARAGIRRFRRRLCRGVTEMLLDSKYIE